MSSAGERIGTGPHPFQLKHFPESRFGGFSRSDGTVAFYSRVGALIEPHHFVLNVGCGRGRFLEDGNSFRKSLQSFAGRCRHVIGIDIDDAGASNPSIDEFRPITGLPWPVETSSIDVCVADYVLEHIVEPLAFLAECARVLRPGGFLCIRTTNARGYVGLAARLVPNRFHVAVVSRAQSNREEADVFPTYYRCNTVTALRRALKALDFDHAVFAHQPEPAYFARSQRLYGAAVQLGRITPPTLRTMLFAYARKN